MKLNVGWLFCKLCVWSVVGTDCATGAPSSPVRVEIDGQTWLAQQIVDETFSNATWRDRWVVEGKGRIESHDRRLQIVTPEPAGNSSVGVTLWLRESVPANVLLECRSGSLPTAERNAVNINLFFHASEADSGPLRFGRSGKYGEYHRIPNYIFTLTGDFQGQRGHARARRNPGFLLMNEESSVRSVVGQSYRIRVIIADGRLRYWLDDRLIHDVRDPRPLPGGHFGLRTWKSQVWWSDVRIYALKSGSNENEERARPEALRPAKVETEHRR